MDDLKARLETIEEEEKAERLAKGVTNEDDEKGLMKEIEISDIFKSWVSIFLSISNNQKASALPQYTIYCINRASGVDTQVRDLKEENPEFLEFITVKGAHILQLDKDSSKTEYRGFSLEDWLDMPRQRLNKYPTLIKV